MQQTLDTYFNTSRRRIVPENFSLYWNNESPSVSFNANGIFIKSTTIRFCGTYYEINLYSNEKYEPYIFEEGCDFDSRAVPFLKSMLQKAIRRGLKNHSIYACYTLLKIDHMEVYRRLPIIMVEDVRLHKGFGVLVWYMMCNIPPSANLVKWILGLVIFLCQVPTYVEYEKGCQLPKNIPRYENVWTLIFRIEYGGMKGDIEMLTCIALKCLHNQTVVLENKIKLFESFDKIEYSILYEAVDFHIYPKIINIISETLNYSKEDVKKMMWMNDSGNNYRKPLQNYLIEDWIRIKSFVQNLQINYLNALKIYDFNVK